MNSPAPQVKNKRHPPQPINLKQAAWVFVSASHEPRHLYDIVWGVEALRAAGVADSQIFIFQDQSQADLHFNPYGITKNIYHLTDIEAVLPKIGSFEFLFLTLTGHGSSEGIVTGTKKMAPQLFVNLIRSIPNLKHGILLVGQCYSGIFDYLDTYEAPEFCVMGATKLHLSLSHGIPPRLNPIKLKDLTGTILPEWNANVFLFYFFLWLRNPIDVDGDGLTSLIDGFKFAGSRSNEVLTLAKTIAGLDMDGVLEETKLKIREHHLGKKVLNQIEVDTALKTADELSKGFYSHQEPWILNANLLRSLVIS